MGIYLLSMQRKNLPINTWKPSSQVEEYLQNAMETVTSQVLVFSFQFFLCEQTSS